MAVATEGTLLGIITEHRIVYNTFLANDMLKETQATDVDKMMVDLEEERQDVIKRAAKFR